jgi:hypothetical protein
VDASLSHRRKLARAQTHIHDVEAMLNCWLRDGYRVIEEANSEGRVVLHAEQLKPLPDQIPLVIGDALHCQRSSLDQLIFAISKAHSPNMTSEDEEDPAFPMPFRDEAVKVTSKRLKHLNATAKQDVCALAPDPARQPFNQDPLWLLNKVENRDKHREIAVAASAASAVKYVLTASDGSDYYRSFGPQRMDLGTRTMPIVEFARNSNVKSQITVAAQILFDEGTEVAGRDVLGTLMWFQQHIENTVFERLEPHL